MKKILLLLAIISVNCASLLAYSSQGKYVASSHVATILTAPEDPEREIEIFPNPLTGGRLTVTSSDQILTIQVLNITGKMEFNQDYQPGTYSAVLELNKLDKGLYLVRIYFDNKEVHTEKVMVK